MKKLNKKSLSLALHVVRSLTDDAAVRAAGGKHIVYSLQGTCLSLATCGISCNEYC